MRRLLTLALLLAVACESPVEEAPACAADQVQDDDSGVCVPAHCGTGTWGTADRSSDTVHVAPWGDDDGDGSEDDPLESIQEGADRAGDEGGGLVVVAAGSYVENVDFDGDHDGVRVQGRCPELVTLDGSDRGEPGILGWWGSVEVAGLTVTGGTVGVWLDSWLPGRGELLLQDMVLDGNSDEGLVVTGSTASLTVERTVVRNTLPAIDGSLGRGVEVAFGATMVASDVLVEGNIDQGLVVASEGTEVALDGFVVRGTLPRDDGKFGRGITAMDGASLVGAGVVLEGNSDVGLYVEEPGTRVELTDSAVRDTRSRPDGSRGQGVSVELGGLLVADGLSVEDNTAIGLVVSDLGSRVELTDSNVRTTAPRPDGTGGQGIVATEWGALEAVGLVVEDNHDTGLVVQLDATATIQSVQVGGDGLAEDAIGWGIGVIDGGSLTAVDLLVDRARGVGLVGSGAGATVVLEQATIQDTQVGVGWGRGIELADGVQLTATDLLLEGNHDVGLVAWTDTLVQLERATVRGTRSAIDGESARAIGVFDGADLEAIDLLLEDNRSIGLAVRGAGSTATVTGAEVIRTRSSSQTAEGLGVSVEWQAVAELTDLVARDNEGPALYVVAAGELTVRDPLLEGNGFAGAAVMDAGQLSLIGGQVSGSTFHPSEGGGLGLFASDHETQSSLEVDGTTFTNLRGPALYLRGQGRYVLRGCAVSDSGSWPSLPGGVLAVGGVEAWSELGDTGYFEGLLLEGNTFSDLAGDAVLLDGSSALLNVHPESGAPNTFSDLEGEDLVWQRCSDLPAPEVLDGSAAIPDCAAEPRLLGPALEYLLNPSEVDQVR